MNPADAARLLGLASSFDGRNVGEATARAWALALRDVPLDQDTLDAVARFYGDLDPSDRFEPTRRRWLEPHHVRYHRRQIRNARLSQVNPTYAGSPEETPAEAIRNSRALTKAAADGQLEPTSVTAAIDSGHGVDPTGKGAALLRSVGRQSQSRRPEFAAPCPHCRARAGAPCVSGKGDRRRDAHPSRIDASRAVNSGQPVPSADLVQQEIDRRRAASCSVLASLPPDAAPEPQDGFTPDGPTEPDEAGEAS